MISFSELWEKCESIYQDNNEDSSVILDELNMKVNLFKTLNYIQNISEEELQKVKSRTIGEILFTLTKLSMKENINVFESLSMAYQNKIII